MSAAGTAAADVAPAAPAWGDSVRAALPGWLAARAVVAVAWFVNLALVDRRFDGLRPGATQLGLFAWDGAYYRSIAELGYAASPPDAVRFHPLLPLAGGTGTGVLLVANLSALLAAVLVHRLVVVVLDDRDAAGRAATLVALAPPAFALVWAYAEGPYLVLGALQLLALHHRRWAAAGLTGFLAALARPSGLLLAVPAAVEAARGWRRARPVERVDRVAAVVAPVAGIVLFLAWVDRALGDWELPVRIQRDFRGGFVLPPVRLVEGLGELVTDPLGDGLHIPFALLSIWLAWVAWRRLPLSWAALAAVTVVSNLAAANLNSSERYAYGCVPLLVALATVTGGRWWRPTVVLATTGLLGMTVLAWQGELVP
jgi:hypothetical protein